MLEDYRMYVVRLEKMQFTRQITIEGINGGNVQSECESERVHVCLLDK